MAIVFLMACVIYGFGAYFKAPKAQRWMLIAVLFTAVIGVLLTFPEDHSLRVALGGSPAPYLIFAGFAAIALAYRQVLLRLRQRAQNVEPIGVAAKTGGFSDSELERYARHIVLREIGGMGQRKLKNAKVLVIGAGGLGAPALQYLAAAGVGTIGVIDDDVVENANLQRQVIHRDDAIGTPKVFSAQSAMLAQNPHIEVRPYHRRLSLENASTLFAEYELILDGTDNFDTRYLANRTAVALGLPLISGALSQWEGQLSIFDPANGAPCYQCIFPKAPAPELAPSCAEAGVIGPLPGVIGAMMAQEAIKLITGAGTVLRGEMLIYDALFGETRKLSLKPRPDCPICGG
ncbi:MAG: molybdopterin-synthase adenylyltransferase MoeB [Planktotalea sp.]|uniref:HesA/MoeB/ThiF family protein n=1 Tax=Planktotalea sp. TaxID=2029877 RepID=UPI003C718172